MRAALLEDYHRPLELVERPVPEPVDASSVVIRVGGAGVCATDLHAIEGLMGGAGFDVPRVLGHENAGWVHEVGDGVTSVSPGDAVLVYPAWSCGLCVPCRRALGSGRIVAIDTDERRRALARELGADEVLGEQVDVVDAVREATNGAGADVVIDFVATDATHAAGLDMTSRRGVYSTVGYGGMINVPSVALVAGETSIAGNLVGSWIDLWELLQLHARGVVSLRSETHPLDAVNDVLDALRAGDVTGRAVLVP